jgi:hypothetical protein
MFSFAKVLFLRNILCALRMRVNEAIWSFDETRKNGYWDDAFASQGTICIPPDFQEELDGNAPAAVSSIICRNTFDNLHISRYNGFHTNGRQSDGASPEYSGEAPFAHWRLYVKNGEIYDDSSLDNAIRNS